MLFFKNDGAGETQKRESEQGCLRKHSSMKRKCAGENMQITVHPEMEVCSECQFIQGTWLIRICMRYLKYTLFCSILQYSSNSQDPSVNYYYEETRPTRVSIKCNDGSPSFAATHH